MICRNCKTEMNEQRINYLMKSYFICSNCLENRIEFKKERVKIAWLKLYPKQALKNGYVFISITEELTVLYFKLIPKEDYEGKGL